jgi:hypothetical protein
MMMCVDTIKRVKSLAKEIRITQSLVTTRKPTLRSQSHGRSSSVDNVRVGFSSSSVKVRVRTLADVQEDMKNDFQT